MFKISEFARLSHVSVKLLRYYDEIGLLKPAHVDPWSDYRYYTVGQLPRINRIVFLKELGFSLQQVAYLLDEDLPVDEFKGMLRLRRAEVAQRIQAEQDRLAQIEARLAQIEREGQPPAYDVLLRSLPVAAAATAQARVADDARVLDLLNEVEQYVGRRRARASGPPTVIYHGCDEEYMDVEVAVPISGQLPDLRPVRAGAMPEVRLVASLVHSGSYATLSSACAELHRWIDAHGYRVAGPMREVYLSMAADVPLMVPGEFIAAGPDACVTELQLPISAAAGQPGRADRPGLIM